MDRGQVSDVARYTYEVITEPHWEEGYHGRVEEGRDEFLLDMEGASVELMFMHDTIYAGQLS